MNPKTTKRRSSKLQLTKTHSQHTSPLILSHNTPPGSLDFNHLFKKHTHGHSSIKKSINSLISTSSPNLQGSIKHSSPKSPVLNFLSPCNKKSKKLLNHSSLLDLTSNITILKKKLSRVTSENSKLKQQLDKSLPHTSQDLWLSIEHFKTKLKHTLLLN